MKLLILDRGFIDGKTISRCQQDWGVDVLIPLKKNMDIGEEAWALAKASAWQTIRPQPPESKIPPSHRPEEIVRRELKRQQTLAARKAQAPPPPASEVLERTELCPIQGILTG